MPTLLDWRRRWPHLAMGGAVTLALVLGVAALSASPRWQSLPSGDALLRLSFAHSGVRNCRDRTAEELAALPRNMRTPQVCERRRSPVRVELDLDGAPLFAADLSPSGLSGSGPSRVYERFLLPVGAHHLEVRMRDDPAVSGFTHEAAFDIQAAPAESVAIDFNAAAGAFYLH